MATLFEACLLYTSGEAHEMNYKKVMRYLRLNSLVPELLDKVDDKKMGFMLSLIHI